MKQDIENIIKKNLPEKLREDFDKWFFSTKANYTQKGEMNDIADWWLSQINTSLIADEVLKVVVEKIRESKEKWEWEVIEDKFGDFNVCKNCGHLENDPEGVHTCEFKNDVLDDIINLLTNSSTLEGERSEHLSHNKEDKNK